LPRTPSSRHVLVTLRPLSGDASSMATSIAPFELLSAGPRASSCIHYCHKIMAAAPAAPQLRHQPGPRHPTPTPTSALCVARSAAARRCGSPSKTAALLPDKLDDAEAERSCSRPHRLHSCTDAVMRDA
jgi:hypothetical protein